MVYDNVLKLYVDVMITGNWQLPQGTCMNIIILVSSDRAEV